MSQPTFADRLLPICLFVTASLLGCGESKKSLHEMDHVIPAHWPSDFTDAAGKISERLKLLRTDTVDAKTVDTKTDSSATHKELSDLVGWIPELAADTDLSESNWMKLYEASEVARKKLLDTKSIEADLVQDIEKLCALLIESQGLIPQPAGVADASSVEQPSDVVQDAVQTE